MSKRTSPSTIAARYATAIFALAVEAKKEAVVVEEIGALGDAVSANAELKTALSSPLLGRTAKGELLAVLSKKANKITEQSLAVLAAQGRADILPYLAKQLRAKLAEAKGELVAEVETARPLSAAVQKQLTAALSKATGKDVQLAITEKPELLGGVAIQLGSQRLDASLSAALNTLRKNLLAPTNA